MDDEPSFNLDRFIDAQERNFIAEFGWPDENDESYSGEEGEQDS